MIGKTLREWVSKRQFLLREVAGYLVGIGAIALFLIYLAIPGTRRISQWEDSHRLKPQAKLVVEIRTVAPTPAKRWQKAERPRPVPRATVATANPLRTETGALTRAGIEALSRQAAAKRTVSLGNVKFIGKFVLLVLFTIWVIVTFNRWRLRRWRRKTNGGRELPPKAPRTGGSRRSLRRGLIVIVTLLLLGWLALNHLVAFIIVVVGAIIGVGGGYAIDRLFPRRTP